MSRSSQKQNLTNQFRFKTKTNSQKRRLDPIEIHKLSVKQVYPHIKSENKLSSQPIYLQKHLESADQVTEDQCTI